MAPTWAVPSLFFFELVFRYVLSGIQLILKSLLSHVGLSRSTAVTTASTVFRGLGLFCQVLLIHLIAFLAQDVGRYRCTVVLLGTPC